MSSIFGSCFSMASTVANTVVTNAISRPDMALFTPFALSFLSLVAYTKKYPNPTYANKPDDMEGFVLSVAVLVSAVGIKTLLTPKGS